MIIEIKIPSPGESIAEVELASWFVENGSFVEKDQEIGEVESEKATLPLIAEKAGRVELLAEVGDTLAVGAIACKIDTSVQAEKEEDREKPEGNDDGEGNEKPKVTEEGKRERRGREVEGNWYGRGKGKGSRRGDKGKRGKRDSERPGSCKVF
jgi:2-oxoglutarate dehydrogenase E2 component (dihydrolipoamide succinyltransferase)